MLRELEAYERELVRDRFAIGKRPCAAKRASAPVPAPAPAPAPAQDNPSAVGDAAAAAAGRNVNLRPNAVPRPARKPASTLGSFGHATVDEVRGQPLDPNPDSSVSFAPSQRSKSPAAAPSVVAMFRRRPCARCMRAMAGSAPLSRRMGDVVGRGISFSSIISSRGQWAAGRRRRICDCVAGLTTAGTHGDTSVGPSVARVGRSLGLRPAWAERRR